MKIFIAGASGAIGRPLVKELLRRGHSVVGMTRSELGAAALQNLGASAVTVSAFDAQTLRQVMGEANVDVVIDELTALPESPVDMPAYAAGDTRLRLEGGGNLLAAARHCGVKRYVQQSSGFFLQKGVGLGDESEGLAIDASPRIATSARTYTELEARLANAEDIETVILRYGFFYGPGTWYCNAGSAADLARRGELKIIGEGQGVWSWVHIDDAAIATAEAITGPTGVFHIVDDDPSPVSVWLPEFARSVGAAPPAVIPAEIAAAAIDDDTMYYGTKLRGASNALAKRVLGFRPRRLEWLAE